LITVVNSQLPTGTDIDVLIVAFRR